MRKGAMPKIVTETRNFDAQNVSIGNFLVNFVFGFVDILMKMFQC